MAAALTAIFGERVHPRRRHFQLGVAWTVRISETTQEDWEAEEAICENNDWGCENE